MMNSKPLHRTARWGLLSMVLACALVPALRTVQAGDSDEVEIRSATVRAIDRGQRYIASKMHPNGYCIASDGRNVAVVSAAILSFMVNGNLPGEGKYGRQVSAGVQWLLTMSQDKGLLADKRTGQPMYHHGLGTLCVAEVWGQTQDPACKKVLKDAINLLIRTQNNRGGWRYQPRNTHNDDDISVTVMQAMALRAARNSGISVPTDTIKDAVTYIKECKTTSNNELKLPGFSYTPGGNPSFSTTAAGCMSLMICGEYKTNDVKDGLDYVVKAREGKQDEKNWFMYGHYYAAQAMYQAGGSYWRNWYDLGFGTGDTKIVGVAQELVEKQQTTGANAGGFNIQPRTGPAIYDDAIAILILGIPYRYLPIYQR